MNILVHVFYTQMYVFLLGINLGGRIKEYVYIQL